VSSAVPADVLQHGSLAWHRAARRAKRLAWLSLLYMGFEGAVAVAAAIVAGSVALLGFGIDSAIEALASIIIVWRFSATRALSQTAERRAQIAVAISFFLLAPCIAGEAIDKLATGRHAHTSWPGIAVSAFSLAWMPILGVMKKHLGGQLDSPATTGEGTQNLLCAYLAAGVLAGLLTNTLLGWWWLDPIIGLGIAALAIWEGIESWRGKECC
jgi:divalent metal cation (Fe/Co/Zn/Cd) transporter